MASACTNGIDTGFAALGYAKVAIIAEGRCSPRGHRKSGKCRLMLRNSCFARLTRPPAAILILAAKAAKHAHGQICDGLLKLGKPAQRPPSA
jgi:hypothetical protein